MCVIRIFVYNKSIKTMKTIQVKGNPYVPVHERMKHLRECYPHRYSVDTNRFCVWRIIGYLV